MMRGASLFGKLKNSSSSSSTTKKGTATATPGRVSSAPSPARGGTASSVPPHGQPPPQQPQRQAQAGRRQTPPPAHAMPAEARLVRLFPEYEEYEDSAHTQQHQQPSSLVVAPSPPAKPEVKLPDGEKGLENNQGQYNCFINVVIQALWHLTAFRERFISGEGRGHDHCCPGPESCVHCALQAIFMEYQFSEQAIIPPTVLRQSLAVLYKDESRFQMNQIDDAAEALEAILERLHHTERAQKDKNTDPAVLEKKACPCLVHNAFGLRTMDLLRCDSCSATTDPKATSLFVAYAYTYALREARAKTGAGSYSFCQFFQRAAQEDRRWCPNADRCNKMCVVEHHLLYLPKVFSVGLVWPSVEGAPVNEISDVMDMITMQIDMSNIFITNTAIGRYLKQEKAQPRPDGGTTSSLADSLLGSGMLDSIALDNHHSLRDERKPATSNSRIKVKCIYELRGMICYYGQHYNCYFNSPATGQWYVFDDVMVNAVGATWAAVKERCLRGHLQPSVLFYEKKEIVEEEVDVVDEPAPELDKGHMESVLPPSSVELKSTIDEDEDEEIARGLRELNEGGMEALERTIKADILELLLQGEEQWKREREREREQERERERERERDRIRDQEEQERVQAKQAEAEQAALTHRTDDEEEQAEEEGEDEETSTIEMNGSWFVRRPRMEPEDEELVESEEDVHTATTPPSSCEGERAEPNPIQTSGAAVNGAAEICRSVELPTGRVPDPEPRREEEDSEWELIDDEDEFTHITTNGASKRNRQHRTYNDENGNDDEDVEIIFEDERELPDDGHNDLEGEEQARFDDDGDDGYSDDDVEIVDEQEERRKRTNSAFALLPTSGSTSDLDISFTMLDPQRPHGQDGEVQDVLVTHTSWLYRRQCMLYRFAADELLRIEPDTQASKESFRYDEMAHVLLYGSTHMVIRFVEASHPVHCIDGEGADRVAHLLCTRNPAITLARQ